VAEQQEVSKKYLKWAKDLRRKAAPEYPSGAADQILFKKDIAFN